MARAKKEAALTPEERLQAALVPDWEWPYKLPENWCWTYLGVVSEIIMGQSPAGKSTTNDSSYMPLIGGAADMGELYPQVSRFTKTPTKQSQTDDVILSIRATLGRPILSDGIYCLGRGVVAFRSSIVTKEFLRYFFIDQENYLYQNATGTTFAQVDSKTLKSMPFPLPPFHEQRRIVRRVESLFTKLDEAKDKAQKVVDEFKTRKAAILHQAFTGELTAKWREEHGVGMESWEHHQFSDLCAIVRGGSPRPAGDPRYYDGNIPFMKVADITRNDSPYVSKVEYSIKEEGLKKTRMVEANTLLLTNSGATLGVPAITTIRTTFNDGIAAFIGLDIDSLLFYYYFWTSKTAFLRSINMGAAQPNLNTKLIGEVEIDVPQTAERVEIARVLNALLSKEQQAKEAAEAVLDQIDLMKKSILARAFRGELGTNDPSEESTVELLKEIIRRG